MEVAQKASNSCKNYIDCYAAVAASVFAVVVTFITFAIWRDGDISKLGTPYDVNADACGESITGRSFLYYPDPSNLQFPICVSKCPTANTKGTTLVPTQNGGVTALPLQESKLFLGHYCLAEVIKPATIKAAIASATRQQAFFQDIFKSAELFFVVVFVTFLLFSFALIALSDPYVYTIIPVCLRFLPLILSIGLSVWMWYSSHEETASISIALWGIVVFLIACSFLVTLVPFVFPETFERSKLSTLLGVQAIQEMPDLFFCITIASIGVGVLVILTSLCCIEMFSIGRFIPASLHIETSQEMGAIGIASNFELSFSQCFLCGILLLALRLSIETINSFLKLLTVKCAKLWFETPPVRGVRPPSCDIALHALRDSAKSLPAICTAAMTSLLRLPSMIVQFAASERAASHDLNRTASKLYGYVERLEICRTLYNSSSLLKLSDTAGCCYIDCALKSYTEIVHGVAPDHQAGKKYRVEEMISSSFSFVLFYTLFLIVLILSWVVLQLCPAFSTEGQKELFSSVTPLYFCMILAGSMLLIFYESLEAAYVSIILLWFKATSDLGWNSGINSDTVVEFESKTLSQYVHYMQRSANVC